MEQREALELRRSRVRVYVTYVAAGFIFVGGGAFISVLLILKDIDSANSRVTLRHSATPTSGS